MLATELFYLTIIHSFIGYYFECLTLSTLQVCGVSFTRFKYFKAFWACPFTTPMVKGIDKLWKLRGIIDGFNNPRRYIASGVVKTADNSMSAIRIFYRP